MVTNRLTIRQDELDARVLAGLSTEMLRDEVVAVFLAEYEAETQRLATEASDTRPEREVELANLDRQIALTKAAILKGVDAAMFVEEMRIWNARRMVLLAEQEAALDLLPDPSYFTPTSATFIAKRWDS